MFYISSTGHQGTGFLAKILSSHKNIVCWHGSRTVPPSRFAINSMDLEEYVKSLSFCELGCFNKKIFGGIHGFHGTKILNILNKYNGKFFACLRDPVKKINSMFEASLIDYLSLGNLSRPFNLNIYPFIEENKKIINSEFKKELKNKNFKKGIINKFKRYIYYKVDEKKKNQLKKNLQNKFEFLNEKKIINQDFYSKELNLLLKQKNDDQYIKNFEENQKEKNDINEKVLEIILENLDKNVIAKLISKSFIDSLNRALNNDFEIKKSNLNYENILVFEKYTKSLDYVVKIINKIDPNLDTDEFKKINFDEFSKSERMNRHSRINLNLESKDILNKWPDSFTNFFQNYIMDQKLDKFYKDFEYKLF